MGLLHPPGRPHGSISAIGCQKCPHPRCLHPPASLHRRNKNKPQLSPPASSNARIQQTFSASESWITPKQTPQTQIFPKRFTSPSAPLATAVPKPYPTQTTHHNPRPTAPPAKPHSSSSTRTSQTHPGQQRRRTISSPASLPYRSIAVKIKRVCGAVAQLGERLVRNEEASGSIPLSSTK